MKSICVFLLLALAAADLYSQGKIQYSTQNYVGLLEGESRGAFQLHTIHGVKYQSWYAGVGTGLDYYLYRTIPLFFDINKDIVVHNRNFFVSGDIGTNFAWVTRSTTLVWGGTNPDAKFSPRLYWAGGLGYRAFFKNKREAFLINLGYSFKHVREEGSQQRFCIDPPCQVSTEIYNYKLNRVSVRVGLQF